MRVRRRKHIALHAGPLPTERWSMDFVHDAFADGRPFRVLTVVDQWSRESECLNVHQFVSLEDARQKIEAWRRDYNQDRPHSALGHLTPSEFVTHRQGTRTAEASAIL
jgi:transposase InsO family protein